MRLPNGDRVNRDSRIAPNGQLRLTAQLTNRDKLRAAYYNSNGRTQRYDVGCTATSGNRVSCIAPEAAYALPTPVQQSGDLKWTSTVTNRLLVEVGTSFGVASYRFEYQPENGPNDILKNDSATGWRTVASSTPYQDYLSTVWNIIPKISYVTGTHNFKAGLNLEWGDDRNYIDNHKSIAALNYDSSRPLATQATSVTVRNTPVLRLNELNADSGFFVQDRWTISRLSVFGGFRYDWFSAGWKDQFAPANPFVPERTIPAADLPAVLPGLVDPRRRLVRSLRDGPHRAEGVGRASSWRPTRSAPRRASTRSPRSRTRGRGPTATSTAR